MENIPLETMTMYELQQLCKDEQLAWYGTKSQMIERIKAKALSTVTSDMSPVIETTESQVNTIMSNIIAASDADIKQYTPINDHSKLVAEIMDEIKTRYPRIVVNYSDSDECFTFDGGRQGRVTTTSRQSKPAVVAVAKTYHNVMTMGVQNDYGSVGGI